MQKGQKDQNNEFKTLWIERTILEIDTPLPNILRWFEVKSEPIIRELTPVEVACETMEMTIRELQELSNQYRPDSSTNININPFTMRLQGTIDANVQGGIPKYQEAFLSEAYLKSPEGRKTNTYVQKLRHLIGELLNVLETALELHERLIPSQMKPLHNVLVERLQKIRESVVGLSRLRRMNTDSSNSIINTPLPPLPISTSHHDYEIDDIYTPVRTDLRRSLELPDLPSAPPVPLRSKADFMSPEVPPKCSTSAPPLPPRGLTPDSKRSSNHLIFGGSLDSSHRPTSYSVVPINYDDSEDFRSNQRIDEIGKQERDSGIEIRDMGDSNATNSLPHYPHSHSHSHLHMAPNIRGHHKTSSNPEFMEMTVTTIQTVTQHTIASCKSINSNESLTFNDQNSLTLSPPAIPPKSVKPCPNSNFYYDDDESLTSNTSASPPLPPIPTLACENNVNHNSNDSSNTNNNNHEEILCEDENCEADCFCPNPPCCSEN